MKNKVFTYRYFLHRWPQLCILAVPTDDAARRPIGCVVCKIDIEDDGDAAAAAAAAVDDATNNSNNAYTASSTNDTAANQKEAIHNKESKIQKLPHLPSGKAYTGYIGMLAVETTHRRYGIGTALVQRAIHRMQQMGCQSIRLETEVTNKGAMTLYEDRLGFVREELLKKYYLNWGDAFRLRLWLVG